MLTVVFRSQITVENWFPVVQAMIGKLYVLSLIHIMCVGLVSSDSYHFLPRVKKCSPYTTRRETYTYVDVHCTSRSYVYINAERWR